MGFPFGSGGFETRPYGLSSPPPLGDELRRRPDRVEAGFGFDAFAEVLQLLLARRALVLRCAGPLNRRNRLGGRRLGFRLGVAPGHGIADQKLEAVVAEREVLASVPRGAELVLAKAQI